MPPVVLSIALAASAFAAARFLRREWQRINRELEAVKPSEPTLRRDPLTGIWRPH